MKEVNRPDAVAMTISVLNTLSTWVGVWVTWPGRSSTPLEQSGVNRRAIAYPPAAYATLFACLAGLALLSTLVTIFRVPETYGRDRHVVRHATADQM